MTTTIERLRNEAKELPLDERELLLAAISYDLRGELPDGGADVASAWDAEIDARVQDIASQRVELIPGQQADRFMDSFIAARRQQPVTAAP